MIKVDWLAACIALILVGAVIVIFFWRWRTICKMHSLPANMKQLARADTEEMSQTLLTNKKQGNLDLVHAANIIKPT